MPRATTPALTRAIGLPQATAMVAGTIIGASIFVQPSEVAARAPSPGATALAWTVAGALTLCGALVCAELASEYPQSGGVYVFLREAFSPSIGFLWGWAMFWTMHSGIIAAIAMIVARYMGFFFPLGPLGTKAVAIVAILLLSFVNYRGVKQGSALQTGLTAAKVFAILVVVAAGFALGPAAARAAGAVAGVSGTAGAAGAATAAGAARAAGAATGTAGLRPEFLLAVAAALFAFGGWHMVTYSAGETIAAERTIPRALGLGVIVVTVCYLALNAVYFHVLPIGVIITSKRVAAAAADAVLGHGGGALLSVLVVVSSFGALSGIVLAGPRVYYAMARDGVLFRAFGAVHPRYRTPHRAITLQAVWACVLVATGSFRALFTLVVYTEWIFFGLLALGLFILRRRGVRRGYSVWGYPVVPAVFAAAAFAVAAAQVAADPVNGLIGLGAIALGLPVYALWARRGYPATDPQQGREVGS